MEKIIQNPISDSPKNPSESSLLVPRILWCVLFVSQFMYYFVAKNLPASPGRVNPAPAYFDLSHSLTKPFLGLAIADVLLIFFAKTLIQKISRTAEPIFIFILRVVLVECICLLGFVLSLIQHDATRMLPFLATSMLGFFILFPTRNRSIQKN